MTWCVIMALTCVAAGVCMNSFEKQVKEIFQTLLDDLASITEDIDTALEYETTAAAGKGKVYMHDLEIGRFKTAINRFREDLVLACQTYAKQRDANKITFSSTYIANELVKIKAKIKTIKRKLPTDQYEKLPTDIKELANTLLKIKPTDFEKYFEINYQFFVNTHISLKSSYH